jgi:hypothetical protein
MVYLGILFWRRSSARESLGILLPVLEQYPGSNADPKSLPPFSLPPEGELPFLSVSGHFHSAANTGLQRPLRGVLFSPVF